MRLNCDLKTNCMRSYTKANRLVIFVTFLKANCTTSYSKANRLVRFDDCPESKLYQISQKLSKCLPYPRAFGFILSP